MTIALASVLVLGCGAPPGAELFVRPSRVVAADAIVVLGNRPPRGADGRVAPETARRVERGAELFAARLAPRLVVSGGPAPGGGTEAEVMSAYARELGVPAAAILEERASRDTAENARLTRALLCPPGGPCAQRVIVVTTPHHLRRAMRLFACAGFDVQGAAASLADDYGYQASFTAYEYAVGIASVLGDACSRARPP
ncbi:MAG: YdcF family protein [Sandaracinaceae bacterium]